MTSLENLDDWLISLKVGMEYGWRLLFSRFMFMRTIELDGSTWKTRDDFYAAFFKAVGAPERHGRNFNALRDSIVIGRINQISLLKISETAL
jgi:hypothetical protein